MINLIFPYLQLSFSSRLERWLCFVPVVVDWTCFQVPQSIRPSLWRFCPFRQEVGTFLSLFIFIKSEIRQITRKKFNLKILLSPWSKIPQSFLLRVLTLSNSSRSFTFSNRRLSISIFFWVNSSCNWAKRGCSSWRDYE